MSRPTEGPGRGAYGLRLLDAADADQPLVGSADRWLLEADPSWPAWEIAYERVGEGWADLVEEFDADRAVLRAQPDGRLTLVRAAQRATLALAEPLTAEGLVHPYLATTAAFAGHWLGRSTFHGGSFALEGRVWGLLGDQEAGKSTTLMALHSIGVPVVSDDLVVVEDRRVLGGPRCLDLRRSTAEWFGVGRPLGRIGRRERWRVDLPMLEGPLPIAGWVVLAWSEELAIRQLDAAGRLGALATNRAVQAPGATPPQFLELAGLPTLLFARPSERSVLKSALEQLLDRLVEIAALDRV